MKPRPPIDPASVVRAPTSREGGAATVVRLNLFFATILQKELERLERKVRPEAISDEVHPIEGLSHDEREWVSKMFLSTAKIRHSAAREAARIRQVNEKIRRDAMREAKAGRPAHTQNQPLGSSLGVEDMAETLPEDEILRLRKLDGARCC